MSFLLQLSGHKRTSLLFLIGIILLGLFFTPLFSTHASASSVDFTLAWDKNDPNLTVSGSLSGTLSASTVGASTLGGTVSGGPDGCTTLTLDINSTNTSATVTPYAPPTEPSAELSSPCYGQYFSSTESDTENIPISGTRLETETHAQELTQITLNTTNMVADVAPSSLEFLFYNGGSSSGSTVTTTNAGQTDNTGNLVETASNANIDYISPDVYLTPGQYTVCFNPILDSCQTFTKVSGVTFVKTYNARGVIAVEVSDSYGGYNGTTETVGPVTATLQQNGQTLQTITTDSVTVSSSVSADAGTASTSTTATLNGVFTDVSPGTYQVCPGGSADGALSSSSCVSVVVAANGTASPQPVMLTENTTPSAGTGSDTPSCQSSGGPLSWFTCAVINGISSAEQSLEGLLQGLLHTQPVDLNPADCQSGAASQNYTTCTYNVWSSIRVYGDILLVIAVLAIVLVEALGGGTVGAYSIRKILPRILITAILINLSIYIVAALIDITNIIGSGLYGFITGPFKETGTYHINITAGAGNLFGASSLLAIVGSAGAIWALASVHGLGDAVSMLVLFVGLPVLFAIIGVVLTIFFRMILIVLLLMVSPIAFALYCFPNTEQYFQKWWDLLFKTLMVYPIIMLIFAACDLGAVIVSSFPTGGYQWLGELMAIVGVAAPLFLVPLAFKISGGVVGQIYGGVSSFGHKATESIKGNPNDPNSLRNRTTRRFRIRRAAAGIGAGAIGTVLNPRNVTETGRRNARARRSAFRQAGLELLRRQEEETPLYRAAQGDSNIMHQLAGFGSGGEARSAANGWRNNELSNLQNKLNTGQITADEAVIARADIEREFDQRNAAIAVAERIGYNPATRRAALLNQYQIGFEMSAGETGWNEAVAAARDISGGDAFQFRSIMDEFQAIAKGPAGRVDLAGNTDGNVTYNGNRAWSSGSLYAIGQGKPKAVQGSAEYYNDLVTRISNNSLDDRDQDFVNEAKERNVDPRVVAAEAIGVFYGETTQLAQSASGGVRDAAIAARRKLGNTIRTTMPDELIGNMTANLTQVPNDKAEALTRNSEVRTKSRAYEPPTTTAQQQGPQGQQGP